MALCAACAVALGVAQVSGAHFNDPNYNPGDVQSFDGLDDAAAEERARDITKYVEDLNNDINTAERDGDITPERASQIRSVVNQRVAETRRNYENRKRNSGGGGGGNGGGGKGSEAPASTPNGNGAGVPGRKPNGNNRGGSGKPDPGSGRNSPNAPNNGNSPTPLTTPLPSHGAAPGVAGVGVGGALLVVPGDDGSSGGGSAEDRLRALINGTANNNVAVDISNNKELRQLLTQATTGIPLGFQALLMALLFVVALLLVLVLRERRRAQHVERVSQLDYLTGLANREGFDRMLGIEWRRAMRYGHTLGLVFIDLDDFKRFNDTQGHLAGDRLLREVAAVINSEARASDYTARLGGDEFVILCPETDAGGLEALARRLEAASVGLAVSLSIGFTHQLPTDTTAEDLVGRADSAMYQAKADRGSFPVPGGGVASRARREP